MATVETRLRPADVPARLDEMRRWLVGRGPVKFTSTGSRDEAVILVEFASSHDAEEFAKQFSGTLIDG